MSTSRPSSLGFAWRSAQPGAPVVHGDLVVTTRLRAVGPLTGVQPVDTAERRQLTQVLDGAAQVVADIARWNGTTAARIGRANLVYVQAATLTGGQVTDNAALNGPTGQQGSGRRQTRLRQAVRNEVPNAGASWA